MTIWGNTMSVTMISGTVSAYREKRSGPTGGTVQGNQVTLTTPAATSTFRIGNRAVTMAAVPDLMDGDPVVAAGKETNGPFRVIALRNDTTNLIYSEPHFPTWMLVAMMAAPILLSPMFMFGAFAGFIFAVMAGPLFTLAGIWHWFKRIPVLEAWEMVRTAPRTSQPDPVSPS